MSSRPDDKKTFLIATADPKRRDSIESYILGHISLPIIFSAEDGASALIKIKNSAPNVLITDIELPKLDGISLVEGVLGDSADSNLKRMGIVLLSPPPEEEKFVDDIVTGRVHFVSKSENNTDLGQAIMRALSFAFHGDNHEYHLRFLAENDILMNEGEKGDCVYIVRRGELMAYHTDNETIKVLGRIGMGEFVGEMSYFNGEPRSASVKALTDCELIEIPLGTLDHVLYTRPAWSKTLMLTLTKRIKKANIEKVSA